MTQGNFLRAVVAGFIATIAAVAVVVPMISAAMAKPVGIFFGNTPMPGAMLVGALVGHLAYGIALGLAYTPVQES